jgi:hypothetical protein
MPEAKDLLVMATHQTWPEIKNTIETTIEANMALASDLNRMVYCPKSWVKLLYSVLTSPYGEGLLSLVINHKGASDPNSPFFNSWLRLRIGRSSFNITFHQANGKDTYSVDYRVFNLNPIGLSKLFWTYVEIFSPGATRKLEEADPANTKKRLVEIL